MTDARPLRELLDEITEEQVRKALHAARGVKTVTAEILGVSRPTLDAMIRRYNIDVERVTNP